jgi:hypothetical protein
MCRCQLRGLTRKTLREAREENDQAAVGSADGGDHGGGLLVWTSSAGGLTCCRAPTGLPGILSSHYVNSNLRQDILVRLAAQAIQK